MKFPVTESTDLLTRVEDFSGLVIIMERDRDPITNAMSPLPPDLLCCTTPRGRLGSLFIY